MILDFSSMLGIAVGVGSTNKRAIEKASAENTAAIADLKREIVRLNGGTVEPERTVFHSEYLHMPPVRREPPATSTFNVAVIGICGLVAFILVWLVCGTLHYLAEHP